MVLLTLVTIILTAYVAMVIFIERRKRYWARKGVPYVEMEIPFISSKKDQKPRTYFQAFQDLHMQYKNMGHKHVGFFSAMRPNYLPIDPDLIKNILIRDFAYFTDRGVYYTEKGDPLGGQLFNLEGERWKNLRVKLTPTFTSGKMKMMFQTVVDCGYPMVERLDELCSKGEAIEIKEILACFTTDVIGSAAFGLECNSFKCGDQDSEFRAAAKRFFDMSGKRKFRMIAIALFPEICKALGVSMFEKSLRDFYFNVVKDTIRHREENKIVRNDFMHLLLEIKNKKDINGVEGITLEEIAAQSFLFFIAGFETSSTLMHYCLYELAENPDIQERLREEILTNLDENDGRLTYDGIMTLKYLGQVLDETLRKHPSVPNLFRKCVSDYKIPGTDVTIDAGTNLFISTSALHYDPEYYPDPEKFDPERFTDENKAKRHSCVYLPFGEGPRVCIGLRFGIMQSRVGIALLLKNFRVKLHPKTITPIGMDPRAVLTSPKNRVYLELEKL